MAGINHEAVKAHGDKGLHTEWNADHQQKGDHDCEQHQHLNHVWENRTDWPAGPVQGQVIYRTDLNNGFFWDGTTWQSLQSVATIIVAADGSGHYTDIQDGIDALPASGGAVYVKEGTYTILAGLTIAVANVALIGSGKATIITGDFVGDMLTVNADDTIVQNLYFLRTGVPAANDACIRILVERAFISHNIFEANNLLMRLLADGCSIISNVFLNGVGVGTTGIKMAAGKSENKIINNYLEGSSMIGLDFAGGDRNIVNSNSFFNCDNGIVGAGGTYTNIVSDNVIIDCVNDGINFSAHCDRNIINSNIVDGCDDGIIIGNANCDRNIITSNVCYSNTTSQITDLGTNTVLDNNVVV